MKTLDQKRQLITNNKFGLGLAALGRPAYINIGHDLDFKNQSSEQSMQERTHEMLDAAWDKGIRYFDAARSYGLAESFLANWLNKNPEKANEVLISSKWGYTYVANWNANAKDHEIKEHSLSNLNKQWDETSQLLSKHLDFYLVHSATLESGILQNKPLLLKLSQLKTLGVSIGISVSGENQATTIAQALAIQIDGERLFDVIQVTYNLLETSPREQMKLAHNEGVLVVVKEGVANGLLTSRNNTDNSYLKKIQTIANELNTSVDALALAMIHQEEFIDVVLSGASTSEQLNSNLNAQNIILSENNIDALSKLSQRPEEYWTKRSQLTWN